MKRLLCAVFFVFIFTFTVNADSFTLPTNETINGNIVKAENFIESNGIINGDGIFFCNTLDLKGSIEQDLLGAFSTASINATVGGNLRAVAGGIFLYGKISKNVTVVSGRVNLEKASVIGSSAYILSGDVILNGTIEKTSYISAREIIINGTVNGDLYVYTGAKGKLYINETAKINGTLYVNGNYASISPKAEIRQTVKKEIKSKNTNMLLFVLSLVICFVVMSLLAIPYYFIFKNRECKFPRFKSIISFSWKFILYLLISVLFLILLLILSFIILPFKIFIAVLSVFMGSFFFLYLFSIFPLSRLLGSLITRKNGYFSMILGFFIIYFLISILYLGTTVEVLSVISFIFIYTLCVLIYLLGSTMIKTSIFSE